MKDQRITFWLISFSIAINACNLSRCNENQCTFLVIISMPAIHQITAFYFFQEYGIKSEIYAGTLSWACFRQVNNTYQWMKCFVIVECIVIADCFKPYYVIHNFLFF